MKNINIYAFADEASNNFDEQIIALKKNNLQGIEIRGVDGENISDISIEKAKIIKTKLDDAGLIAWSIGSPLGKVKIENDFNEHVDKLKHTLEISSILDSKNIRMFSFFMDDGKNPADYKDEVIERLSKMVEIAKPYGIDLCHENEKGIYGDIACRCLDVLKAVPNLKGIFDPANFIQCNQDTLEAWDMLSSYIKYFHVKDAQENGFVVPSGKGAGNVQIIANKFIALGGKDFTIEPHLTVFDGLAELEQEGDKSVVGEVFKFASKEEAFDVACNSFKSLI
ncbi:MAG: TIM barrel protein [Clostridia bacterium]